MIQIFLICLIFSVILLHPLPGMTEQISWGGDLRARFVDFLRIPTERGSLLPETRFFRLRSRIWGFYSFNKDISLKARIVIAWREYDTDKGTNKYRAMDEFVFDTF